MPKRKSANNWAFIVPDHAFIDYDLIAQDLSYKKPLIWITSKSSSGDTIHELMVHNALLVKGFKPRMNKFAEGQGFTLYKSQNPFDKRLVKEARRVKTLPWNRTLTREQVEVYRPRV